MNSKRKWPHLLAISLATVLILAVFSFPRLKPVLHDAVPYTYDQGRDFYKAAEIVTKKDLTFIGPTTGIDGLFHGAWWYYYLTIPFIFFGGSPSGFYYANFLLHLASLGGLVLVLYRFVNKWVALTVSAIIAVSPYFISTSIFVGNNIMVLPSLLLFLITHFFLFEKYPKKILSQIGIFTSLGFSLGMIAEFEFAFGLMLIPIYFLLSLALPYLRKKLYKRLNILSFLCALFIAFLPRFLFELKNNFSQTRTLLSFIFEPKYFNPKSFYDIFDDRLNMIADFYKTIFPNDFSLAVITLIVCVALIIALIKKQLHFASTIIFYVSMVLGLFSVSLMYRDNFWANYYEGFPYIYIMIIALVLYGGIKLEKNYRVINIALAVCFILFGVVSIAQDFRKPVQQGGLQAMKAAVDYIHSQELNEKFCVKIYTPPVIPHTYNYLFFYHSYKNKETIPETDWVNGKCWIILEKDDYAERKQKWIDDNIPKASTVAQSSLIWDIEVKNVVLNIKK